MTVKQTRKLRIEEKLCLKIGFLLNSNNLLVYNYLSITLAVRLDVKDTASLGIRVSQGNVVIDPLPKQLDNMGVFYLRMVNSKVSTFAFKTSQNNLHKTVSEAVVYKEGKLFSDVLTLKKFTLKLNN